MAQITKTGMAELWEGSTFYGESAAWLESMYETYLSNPEQLEDKWRDYFDALASSKKAAHTNGQSRTRTTSKDSPSKVHSYLINYACLTHTRQL